MMKHMTPAEATEMRTTIRQRSDSFVEFALQIAEKTGDVLAVEICRAEQTRRISAAILATVAPLDPILTWKD
jgi:acetolactate synthase regulatory subunit